MPKCYPKSNLNAYYHRGNWYFFISSYIHPHQNQHHIRQPSQYPLACMTIADSAAAAAAYVYIATTLHVLVVHLPFKFNFELSIFPMIKKRHLRWM